MINSGVARLIPTSACALLVQDLGDLHMRPAFTEQAITVRAIVNMLARCDKASHMQFNKNKNGASPTNIMLKAVESVAQMREDMDAPIDLAACCLCSAIRPQLALVPARVLKW